MSFKINYLVRLDDACPTMDKKKWNKIEQILDKYEIKPMIGIIPNNKDTSLEIDEVDDFFWDKALGWQEKMWTIALHGYDHVYVTKESGINPVQQRSEFAGVSLKQQEDKISKGLKIFQKAKLEAKCFFAPSHTFDLNTIAALKNKSNIRIISDTIAFKPYIKDDFIYHPQQFGRFRNINIPGNWTFCFHPNTMEEESFSKFSCS